MLLSKPLWGRSAILRVQLQGQEQGLHISSIVHSRCSSLSSVPVKKRFQAYGIFHQHLLNSELITPTLEELKHASDVIELVALVK